VVVVVGRTVVVVVGRGLTTTDSPAALHAATAGPLLASPEYEATHRYLPTTVAVNPGEA
jgi:hypothetical protein